MNRPNLVLEEEEIGSRQAHHNAQQSLAPEMELHGAESEESENSHPSEPHVNKQEKHETSLPQKATPHQKNETAEKQRGKRPKGKLISEEEDNVNGRQKGKAEKNSELLPPELPRQRKQSTTFEEKADLLRLAEAGEMKPNLLAPEEAASPTHKRNEHFTLKPHQEHTQEYEPHDQHTRTHQLKQQNHSHNHHESKNRKASIEYGQFQSHLASQERKKVKKLPAIDGQNTASRYQSNPKNTITINESSAIILHTTEAQPQRPKFAQDYDHLEQVTSHSLQNLIQPLGSHSTFSFIRDNSCGNYFHPDYQLQTAEGSCLISAKKEYCHLNSYYTFIAAHGQQEVGFLKGNFGGSEFNLYQMPAPHERRPQLAATITYKTDCPCFRSDYRHVEVYAKVSREADPVFEREAARKNLKELFEEGYSKDIEKLVSKRPSWSQKRQGFVMSFGGKGKLPSVKNMILQSQRHQSHSLLFCKTGTNAFHLQIGSSMTVFVAMGILMSSFDFKLLCQ